MARFFFGVPQGSGYPLQSFSIPLSLHNKKGFSLHTSDSELAKQSLTQHKGV